MSPSELIKFEFIKCKSKSTRFYLITYLSLTTLLFFAAFTLRISVNVDAGAENIPSVEKDIFLNLQLFFEKLSIVPCLIVCVYFLNMVSKEYDYGIFKKHLIDGVEESDILTGKLFFILIACLSLTIFNYIIFLTLGKLLQGFSLGSFFEFKVLSVFALLFYKTFFLCIFSLFIVSLAKSSTSSVVILIGYIVIEQMLMYYLSSKGFEKANNYLPYNSLNYYFNNRVLVSFLTTFIYILAFISVSKITLSKNK